MNNLINDLKSIYPNTEFKESYRDGRKVLVYDDEDLEWDNDFMKLAIEAAHKNLTPNELKELSIIYDYLGEISLENELVFGVDYNFEPKQSYNQLAFSMFTLDIKIEVRKDQERKNYKVDDFITIGSKEVPLECLC